MAIGSSMPVNQIKKLYDLEKTRRVKCRHFTGTVPKGCPRILCTNSEFEAFYPVMKSKQDRKGVLRRQLFQVVQKDVRLRAAGQPQQSAVTGPTLPLQTAPTPAWKQRLTVICEQAHVAQCLEQVCAAAEANGVALPEELVEIGAEMADQSGMRPLQRKRFLSALRS